MNISFIGDCKSIWYLLGRLELVDPYPMLLHRDHDCSYKDGYIIG